MSEAQHSKDEVDYTAPDTDVTWEELMAEANLVGGLAVLVGGLVLAYVIGHWGPTYFGWVIALVTPIMAVHVAVGGSVLNNTFDAMGSVRVVQKAYADKRRRSGGVS